MLEKIQSTLEKLQGVKAIEKNNAIYQTTKKIIFDGKNENWFDLVVQCREQGQKTLFDLLDINESISQTFEIYLDNEKLISFTNVEYMSDDNLPLLAKIIKLFKTCPSVIKMYGEYYQKTNTYYDENEKGERIKKSKVDTYQTSELIQLMF